MKITNLIRTNDWWEYKFPPILAIGYMVAARSGKTLVGLTPVFGIIMLSLICGACYVSFLNDATDISDDAAARKSNRLSGFNRNKVRALVCLPLIAGICCTWHFRTDTRTMIFYMAGYACFTLYSMPPFRLKKRGISGVIADAAGSQLFPTLFMTSFLVSKTNQPVDHFQFACIGIWSFCFGMRGILWHQFHDMHNDLKSGTHTVVHNLNKKDIAVTGTLLICIELSAFTALLLTWQLLLPAILVVLYFVYLYAIDKKWHVCTVLIMPVATAYRIFMNEYYQVFLPVSVLLSIVSDQPTALVLLLFHVALFPFNTARLIRESYQLIAGKH